MANLNKVMLIGNLTRDPETKYLPSGTQVCELGMAINRFYNDQAGERQEQTCFVDLTAFGRQAETLGRYMKKGRPLFVEGRLDYQTWETPEGQKRSKLKVVVEGFQFLGGRDEKDGEMGGGGEAAGGQSRGGGAPRGARGPAGNPAASFNTAPPAMDEDEIPF